MQLQAVRLEPVVLLIEPQGIEMRNRIEINNRKSLLIEPQGIEIQFGAGF